jgi:hypothetical protein
LVRNEQVNLHIHAHTDTYAHSVLRARSIEICNLQALSVAVVCSRTQLKLFGIFAAGASHWLQLFCDHFAELRFALHVRRFAQHHGNRERTLRTFFNVKFNSQMIAPTRTQYTLKNKSIIKY